MKPVETFDDTICELGEGPSYDPVTDTLFWFDINGKRLVERQVEAGTRQIHALPHMASAIATIDADRQLLVTEIGLHVRDRKSGALELIQPVEADNTVTRSNDARVHPSGAFWIGTMGKNAERHAGAIYWFRQGELKRLYPDITIPNSICFSADGSIGYFTDTMKGLLFRVACDPATGMPTGEPDIFVDHRNQPGGLDGSVVDADGNLWNARWGAALVAVYSADGKLLETIDIPTQQPTCPAFIGSDANRIAITSAWEHMSDDERSADPKAGKTFVLSRTVNGRFEPNVLI